MSDSSSQYEMVILGAGPAGISMAVEAINAGIESAKILVLEKFPEHSWSIRKFYPEKKLVTANYKGQSANCEGTMCIIDSSKSETLAYLDQMIADNHVQVNYEEEVFSIKREEEGQFIIESNKGTYKSKTCAVAIGVFGKPNKPSYAIPNGLRGKVHFDITSEPIVESNVLVVGGGDSASEYCQYLIQENNIVTLSYRRDSFSRMNSINKATIEQLGQQGKVRMLLSSDIEKVTDEENVPNVHFIKPEQTTEKFDHVVYALGGTTPKNFLKTIGINFNGDEPEILDNYQTSIPGLFLVGDLSAGKKGGSIISAFNSSHKAMREICTHYLECKID